MKPKGKIKKSVFVLVTALLAAVLFSPGLLYADPVSGDAAGAGAGQEAATGNAGTDGAPGAAPQAPADPTPAPQAAPAPTPQTPATSTPAPQPQVQPLAAPAPANGVVLSGLTVTPVTNRQVKVQYTITNNTAAVLLKSNTIAYYKNEASRTNHLFNRTLQYDVQPGATVAMTDTVSYDRIANLPLVLRLFDNGTTYPTVRPTTFAVGDTSGNVAYRPVDLGATVSISDFSVSRITQTRVTLTYTITNRTSYPVLKSSYYALYKGAADSKSYLTRHTLPQDVAPGASVTMTETVSTGANIGSSPLVMRLFDINSTSTPFPYTAPNLFYDGVTDNKTAYEAIDPSSTVGLSDFSVEKISDNKVTLTYTITNSSNGLVSRTSRVAFYENSPERADLLFTRAVGKDIAPGESAVITDTVTYTDIFSKRIVARLFDNGATFPYISPNAFTDNALDNKTAEAASFKTKIACVGDSITYGYGVDKNYSYTAQLQRKLGDDYAVVNFGVSGTTANSKGSLPYVKQSAYQKALKSEPDIVIIMLGSNDARKANQAPAIAGSFESEYTKLVQSFIDLPNHPKVYVATPIAAAKPNLSISESFLAEDIRPEVRDMANNLGVELIEFESLLSGSQMKTYYISDSMHPSKAGYDVMSTAFYEVLMKG